TGQESLIVALEPRKDESMGLHWLPHWLTRTSPARQGRRFAARYRLGVEQLEDRRLLSASVVLLDPSPSPPAIVTEAEIDDPLIVEVPPTETKEPRLLPELPAEEATGAPAIEIKQV